jgi:hypothetical protein
MFLEAEKSEVIETENMGRQPHGLNIRTSKKCLCVERSFKRWGVFIKIW